MLEQKEQYTSRQPEPAGKDNEHSLRGTFVSVMMLGAFLAATWLGAFLLFMARN